MAGASWSGLVLRLPLMVVLVALLVAIFAAVPVAGYFAWLHFQPRTFQEVLTFFGGCLLALPVVLIPVRLIWMALETTVEKNWQDEWNYWQAYKKRLREHGRG